VEIFDEIDELKAKIAQNKPTGKVWLDSLRAYYRIGLTYASNALEGNSLTESETKVVIEDGLTIGGKPLRDHLEAIGHARAFDDLLKLMKDDLFDEGDIKRLHRLFYEGIDPENAGEYRSENVFISGSKYSLPAWEKVPEMMTKYVASLPKMAKTLHPVELAAKAHLGFVFIHPFVDGNGRVARLLMNLVLLQNGYTIAVIPPINRAKYIEALESAHNNDKVFISFIARTVKEGMRELARLMGNGEF
jgi:Fic family protein